MYIFSSLLDSQIREWPDHVFSLFVPLINISHSVMSLVKRHRVAHCFEDLPLPDDLCHLILLYVTPCRACHRLSNQHGTCKKCGDGLCEYCSVVCERCEERVCENARFYDCWMYHFGSGKQICWLCMIPAYVSDWSS